MASALQVAAAAFGGFVGWRGDFDDVFVSVGGDLDDVVGGEAVIEVRDCGFDGWVLEDEDCTHP